MPATASFRQRFLRQCLPWLALLPVLVGCGTPGPNGDPDSFGLDLTPPEGTTPQGVVVFVVDGVNATVFQEMLDAGELPAINQYFVQRGLYAPRAVANIPAVTLASLTSIATGRYPGHHDVLGVNWFDRHRHVWRSYDTVEQKNLVDGDCTAPMLFEYFPEDMTASLFFQPHRGAEKFFENWLSNGPLFGFGLFEDMDRVTLFRFGELMHLARTRTPPAFPKITVAYLLAPDFRAYGFGVNTPQYRNALRHTDHQIGRVLGDMQRAGWLETLHIALVSDHSHTDVEHHNQLHHDLKNVIGLPLANDRLWECTDAVVREMYFHRFPAVLNMSGDRYAALQLRRPYRRDGEWRFAPWPARPDPEHLRNYPTDNGPTDLLDALMHHPSVGTIAWAIDENACRVRNHTGELEFRQPDGPGGTISCRVINGENPLDWAEAFAEGLDGLRLPPRDWLRRTLPTTYPDLPAQLLAYFRSRRAGDVAIFAAPHWDFHNRNRAGHGGIRAEEDMLVPLLLAGPKVPVGRRDVARTIDLVPTILDILGRPIPPNLDGESLLTPPSSPLVAPRQ